MTVLSFESTDDKRARADLWRKRLISPHALRSRCQVRLAHPSVNQKKKVPIPLKELGHKRFIISVLLQLLWPLAAEPRRWLTFSKQQKSALEIAKKRVSPCQKASLSHRHLFSPLRGFHTAAWRRRDSLEVCRAAAAAIAFCDATSQNKVSCEMCS